MSKQYNLKDQLLAQHPNEEQREAIFSEDLEFLLRAAPGTGKTWTSCRRFIWRAVNWPYKAGGLALLSFTNAAVREFQVATMNVGKGEILFDPNYVGTFDSFVERFIFSPFGHLIARTNKRPKLFTSARPGDHGNSKLMAWTELSGGRKAQVPAWEIIPYPDNTKIAFKASKKFGGRKLIFSGHNPVFELLSMGFYTHAQRVYWACTLLFERPYLAELLAKRFPEIIVDEAQDTNVWLMILLNFLRNKGARITLVGDPDQCIYEFSMADATSLPALREKWSIPEKPLSQSFRCNNQIASAVRNIVGNQAFCGRGDCVLGQRHPIIIRDPSTTYAASIAIFQQSLRQMGIPERSSAIICRAHRQLETIRGHTNYTNLQGLPKELAQASFFRDTHRNYKMAFRIVGNSMRSITEGPSIWELVDEFPESESSQKINQALWNFVKSEKGLPPISMNGDQWILHLRQSVANLLNEIGIQVPHNLNRKITKKGLDDRQSKLPLLQDQVLFPSIRQETIHQVKGESIDAVLVLGSPQFWNSVLESIISKNNSEERRLAYVAMTRARDLLIVGLPADHFDKYADKWVGWGFETFENSSIDAIKNDNCHTT